MTLVTGRRTDLAARLEALDEVLALARDRVDVEVVAEAERIAGKAGDRLRFGAAHTVVALAGSTGSGKSSLFNALIGEPVSEVGLRRPTTGVAHAAVWGDAPAGELLDWLDVPRRHLLRQRPGSDPESGFDPGLDGLVLLDLPDLDSVDQRHRLVADRLVERVDMLIWVLDPQKYADKVVHERYLAPLSGHADVMLVVLNQVDRLSEAASKGCLADLSRLLDSEGLAAVPVLPTSTRTDVGLAALRAELARRVAAKRAAVRRLEADLSELADALDESCAGSAARGVGRTERQSLAQALSDAAGADLIADAVAGAHRLRARRATGWPLTRWTSRLRLDPARRLRLRDTPSELVRTSLPGPSGVQRARVDSALRELAERACVGLAEPWPTLVRKAATSSRSELPELLDRAVAGTDLGLGRPPRWWRFAGAVQLLLVVTAAAGLLWLAALFAIAWLQLPDPPLPHWGPLPVPTILLAGGLVLGLLLAVVSGLFAKIGARRRAQRARRRLAERVRRLADEVVIEPVERELAAHRALCQALSRVRG
jgi:GTP-binding protein EngB required for normal cell division